jgi:hypothetical protein
VLVKATVSVPGGLQRVKHRKEGLGLTTQVTSGELIEPGPGTPKCNALCFIAEFITASGGTRVPCSRALFPGPNRDSVALTTGPGHSDTDGTDSASRVLRDEGGFAGCFSISGRTLTRIQSYQRRH